VNNARPAPRSTSKPASRQKVDIDLDALDTPDGEPFIAKVGGQPVRFHPVDDLDWQIVASIDPNYPRAAIDNLLFEEDKEHFYAQKIKLPAIRQLFDLYMQRFGVDLGESDA
jgi:hypothetical protein